MLGVCLVPPAAVSAEFPAAEGLPSAVSAGMGLDHKDKVREPAAKVGAERRQSLRLTLTSAPRCPVQLHLPLTVLEGPHHSV